jgi:cell division septation protein DedD
VARSLAACACASAGGGRGGAAADFAVTLVSAPSPRTRVDPPGARDTLDVADALAAVANLPLQAPDAVADAVLSLLSRRAPARGLAIVD